MNKLNKIFLVLLSSLFLLVSCSQVEDSSSSSSGDSVHAIMPKKYTRTSGTPASEMVLLLGTWDGAVADDDIVVLLTISHDPQLTKGYYSFMTKTGMMVTPTVSDPPEAPTFRGTIQKGTIIVSGGTYIQKTTHTLNHEIDLINTAVLQVNSNWLETPAEVKGTFTVTTTTLDMTEA